MVKKKNKYMYLCSPIYNEFVQNKTNIKLRYKEKKRKEKKTQFKVVKCGIWMFMD